MNIGVFAQIDFGEARSGSYRAPEGFQGLLLGLLYVCCGGGEVGVVQTQDSRVAAVTGFHGLAHLIHTAAIVADRKAS